MAAATAATVSQTGALIDATAPATAPTALAAADSPVMPAIPRSPARTASSFPILAPDRAASAAWSA